MLLLQYEMMKSHFEEGCLQTLTLLEKILIENNGGDGFFVGDKVNCQDDTEVQ